MRAGSRDRYGHRVSDVEVVGDDAQANPSLHSGRPFVATAVQPVAALHHAAAALAAGAPLLRIAEPALPLHVSALHVLGAEIGDRTALDASLMSVGLVACREEAGVRSDQPRSMSELLLMYIQRGNQ